MRVAAQRDGARQGVAVVGDDLMGDPLLGTDVVEAPDAELLDELAAGVVRGALATVEAGAR